jgi:hypothetical protein
MSAALPLRDARAHLDAAAALRDDGNHTDAVAAAGRAEAACRHLAFVLRQEKAGAADHARWRAMAASLRGGSTT